MSQTQRKESSPVEPRRADETQDQEQALLEDDNRGWCGVRTYITGPQAIPSGRIGHFKSNVHVDADLGCKSFQIDEVLWTVDAPNTYKDQIHIQDQSTDECAIGIEAGVPAGTQFTLHATPKAHALSKGAKTRVACQLNKADAQVINVS